MKPDRPTGRRAGVQSTLDLLAEYDRLNEKLGEEMSDKEMEKLLARQGEGAGGLDSINAWELDSQLEMAMDALRVPPADALIKPLSGGERRRVAMCRLLLQKPDVLLLDEPTNHLDAVSVGWLEQHLQRYEGTVIAVTHDRYFLDNVAGWILELDRGAGIRGKGNYTSWLDQKKSRLEVEEEPESSRQRGAAGARAGVGPAALKTRQAKSKARLKAYETMRTTRRADRRDRNLHPTRPAAG